MSSPPSTPGTIRLTLQLSPGLLGSHRVRDSGPWFASQELEQGLCFPVPGRRAHVTGWHHPMSSVGPPTGHRLEVLALQWGTRVQSGSPATVRMGTSPTATLEPGTHAHAGKCGVLGSAPQALAGGSSGASFPLPPPDPSVHRSLAHAH